jgi:hypothetical protein
MAEGRAASGDCQRQQEQEEDPGECQDRDASAEGMLALRIRGAGIAAGGLVCGAGFQSVACARSQDCSMTRTDLRISWLKAALNLREYID